MHYYLTPSPHCRLPGSVRRGEDSYAQAQSHASAQGPMRRLPDCASRGPASGQAHGYAHVTSGVRCELPSARERGQNGQEPVLRTAAPFRIAIPMEVQRGPAPAARTQPAQPSPEPRPDSAQISEPAPRDRAGLQPEALFPIIQRVARGISGAAGYSYIGEDPEGAGVRYGLLGLRLDTGDMGQALALAEARDGAVFAERLGQHAGAILATATAGDRAMRMMPIGAEAMWSAPMKAVLSKAAGRDIFRAAQNEYATDGLLIAAADKVLAHSALASGTALAMALDLLAELGREQGLATLETVLATAPETTAALKNIIAEACPACRLRLDDFVRDVALREWRPNGQGTGTI